MAKILSADKKKFSRKLLGFRKTGLQQYGKYLDQQLKLAGNRKSKEHYIKYIEKQILLKDKKIKKIEEKLKNLH